MAEQRPAIVTVKTDVLVVGSEGAGCLAAIGAEGRGLSIIMVTKGQWGRSGATVTGAADLAVDSRSLSELGFVGANADDSQELFAKDIIKGGKYQNNQRLVSVLVQQAPSRLRLLQEWGACFKDIISASGHSYPRGVFFPGPGFVQVIRRRAMGVAGLKVLENTVLLDLIRDDQGVTGGLALNMEMGVFMLIRAKAVVLATGGGMSTFKHSTAPAELTGDGTAMAGRAGIPLLDMEFPMFFPGLFAWPPALKKVEVPYHLSAGGIIYGHMYNKLGERFMSKWDPVHMEHATRDIVSVGIYSEILSGNTSRHGGVYVSLKHLPDDLIDDIVEWDPVGSLKRYGFGKAYFDMPAYLPDLKRQSLEAVPASHFFNGGVAIDERCRTSVPGLFAAGEVTGGVHGGNRLSGTAFTDFMVFGLIAGDGAASFALDSDDRAVAADELERVFAPYRAILERCRGRSPYAVKADLQELAWEKLGVIRTTERIEEAKTEIGALKAQIDAEMAVTCRSLVMNRELLAAIEARNIAQNIELIAVAAGQRPESRAAHYLAENPATDYPAWTKNIVLRLLDGEVTSCIQPVVGGVLDPPDAVVHYGHGEGE